MHAKNRRMGDLVGVIAYFWFFSGSKAAEVFNVIWYTLNTINQYLNNKRTLMYAEVIICLNSPAVGYRCR